MLLSHFDLVNLNFENVFKDFDKLEILLDKLICCFDTKSVLFILHTLFWTYIHSEMQNINKQKFLNINFFFITNIKT